MYILLMQSNDGGSEDPVNWPWWVHKTTYASQELAEAARDALF